MTVIAVKRLITPCQVKGVFILMSWGCAVWGNGGARHYLLKGQWQTMYLRKTEKWKITVLSLNKAVLSNIYGTDGKQGQRRAFIDTIGEGCHRIQVRESTKEKFSIVFGGSAYHRVAPRSFQKSNRLCFTVFLCVCGFVKAITYIHYQESAIQEFKKNKKISKRHLVIHWLQAKFKCWSITHTM